MRLRLLEEREESPARRVALAPLAVASWFYGAGARLHRALGERRRSGRRRLSGRVVSVGNLVVGGTGKTPAAAWIAAELHRRGHKVALASRGYRGRGGERVQVVSDGRFVHGRGERAGDEAFVLAAHAPGVPVLVGRDRALVGLRALSAFGADVLVLDDGFQHHRLERDVDLVTVDASFGFGNRRLLPRGPLREPLSALGRADAVLVIDGPLDAADAACLDRHAPAARRFAASRRPRSLRALRGGAAEPPAALAGRRVGLLAGLARPGAFRRSLEALGAEVVAERVFRDHHRYRPSDVEDLSSQAPLWITTEKDAGKLLPAWVGRAEVRVLRIELAVDDGAAFLTWLEGRLRARR